MDEMEYLDVETVILTEEDGTEAEYAILDKFDYEGKSYVVLAEIDDEGALADDEFLFTYEVEGDDMVISSVEDDAEFERVSAYYESLGEEE